MEWQSDEETLNAVLQFVDGFVSTPPLRVPDPQPTAYHRRVSRLREELQELRATAAQLEEHLTALKKAKAITVGTNNTACTGFALTWETLASRQRNRRREAEVENAKLRTLLEQHVCVAKKLQRLLTKSYTIQRIEDPRLTLRLGDLGRARFQLSCQELMKNVQQMQQRTSAIFSTGRFVHMAQSGDSIRDLVTREDDNLGVVVEMVDSSVVPFGVHDLANAVWHHIANQTLAQATIYCQTHESTDTSIQQELGSVVDMPEIKATFMGNMVGRRYIQGDVVAIVWMVSMEMKTLRGHSKPVGDGFATTQQGWTLIRPLAQGKSTGAYSPVGSLVQVYQLSTPETRDIVDSRRRPMALDNYVNFLRFKVEEASRMVENFLVDSLLLDRASSKRS